MRRRRRAALLRAPSRLSLSLPSPSVSGEEASPSPSFPCRGMQLPRGSFRSSVVTRLPSDSPTHQGTRLHLGVLEGLEIEKRERRREEGILGI